jgi:hypothetical protein
MVVALQGHPGHDGQAGLPAVLCNGASLKEGHAGASRGRSAAAPPWHGDRAPAARRQQCRIAGCGPMRSRGPVTSTGNHALKIAARYVLHPATNAHTRPDPGVR